MRNIIFIEEQYWLNDILDGMYIEGFSDFQYTCAVVGPDRINAFLETEKDIGCFAIVGKDKAKYASSFPNNFVMLDENDIGKTCKNIIYIMTNFGHESRSTDNIWFTSDTHFYHQNIIKYCNRPWATAEEMTEGMIARWNSVVGENDKVFHLGDFSFGNRAKVEAAFKRLNGKIDLVMGNHDRLRVKDYYEIGFHRVYDKPILFANFFILSHAPIQWVKDGDVYANLFGHVHNMEMYKTYTKNSCCVCVERHDYKPISFNEIKTNLQNQA